MTLSPLYQEKFMAMVEKAIELETNFDNIDALKSILPLHFITGFTHEEVYKTIQYCNSNCNQLVKPIYESLLVGIDMSLLTLKTMN